MDYRDYQHLAFERRPNGVVLITINRPEVLNATNDRLHWELTQIWLTLDADETRPGGGRDRRRPRPSRPAAISTWSTPTAATPSVSPGTMREASGHRLQHDQPATSR